MTTATNKTVICVITKFYMVKYGTLLDCVWHFNFTSLNCKNLFFTILMTFIITETRILYNTCAAVTT